MPLPRVIGHRGAAALAPENTLAAFRRAAVAGARWVEFDVRCTADGVPVVFHDATLGRTTDGRGRLDRTPLAALRRLDAGAWFGPEYAGEPVPTLEEALGLLAALGLGANIEVKADGDADAAATAQASVAAARRVWPADAPAPLLSSYSPAALAAAAAAAPAWPRGLVRRRLSRDDLAAVQELGCRSLHLDHRRLNGVQVGAVRAAGLVPVAWTVNDADRAGRLWRWGVAAVITDDPGRMAAAAGEFIETERRGQ